MPAEEVSVYLADLEPERGPKALVQLNAVDVVERVAELLELAYRSADLGNLSDVLAEAVYILLSLNTQQVVYERVFVDLRRTFPTWREVADASLDDLRRVLQPAGLQRQRAATLKALMGAVEADNLARGRTSTGGDLTLEYLHEMSDEQVELFLLALPGIGPKSARCIMAYSLDRSSFAVDTHVARIFRRLGLVPPRRSVNSKVNHAEFEAVVPKRLRKQLHMNLIHHGRAVCQSQARCSGCVLVSFCSDGQRTVSAENSRPTAVDLFGGAGGLGSGFRQGGFKVALAVELDTPSAQTYRLNNPGVPVIEADVSSLTAETIRSICPHLGDPDVILAGPPCQGYSAAGDRDPGDAKNVLYLHVIRLANQLRAKTLVIENVPGIHRVNGVRFTGKILQQMRRYFRADSQELVASDFGVPQNRRRVFFVGHRKDLTGNTGTLIATHTRTGSPAVAGRPETQRLDETLAGPLELPAGCDAEHHLTDDGTVVYNASTMRHSEAVIAKIAGIGPGEGPISYRRLSRDEARTLVAGHRALPVHPWLDRTISVREAARIQGFDDSYVFAGPRARQPLQVANAVPPPLAKALAEHLLTSAPS